MKSNGAGAEFDFKITEKYLFLLLRVQLQCNVDELGGKSTEVIAKLDLFSLRVNIALESTLVHRVQLQCNADEMEGKSTKAIAHIAPRGAKKEEAFCGVILKSERPSGALFKNSGPPFFTVESKIEVLSPLGTSFH